MESIYIYISNEHGGLENQFLISNLLRSCGLCQEIWFDKADLKDLYLSFQVDTFDVFVSKNLEVQNCDCEKPNRSQLSKKISRFF